MPKRLREDDDDPSTAPVAIAKYEAPEGFITGPDPIDEDSDSDLDEFDEYDDGAGFDDPGKVKDTRGIFWPWEVKKRGF